MLTNLNQLQNERLKRGMSLRDLGDLSGVDFTTIGKIENGKVTPKVDTLQKIVHALKMKFVIQ